DLTDPTSFVFVFSRWQARVARNHLASSSQGWPCQSAVRSLGTECQVVLIGVVKVVAVTAAALVIVLTTLARSFTSPCLRLTRYPQRGQHDAREAAAEFFKRPASRDGLGQALGQVIEFVVHNFPCVFVISALILLTVWSRANLSV